MPDFTCDCVAVDPRVCWAIRHQSEVMLPPEETPLCDCDCHKKGRR